MRQAAPAPSPTATGGIARLAAACAREHGITLEPLLRQSDLTSGEIEDWNARIAVEKQVAWLNLVAAALSDDLLGLHLARDFDLRLVGLLYFVLASAPTLGDALRELSGTAQSLTRALSCVASEMTLFVCNSRISACRDIQIATRSSSLR